jgi:filamentous hemagglutinin family protein
LEINVKSDFAPKTHPLVAALALALAAPLAQAAAPAAGALPGGFYTNQAAGVGYALTGATGTITLPSGATVLQWGGTSANVGNAVTPTGTATATAAGFNLGANATLALNNTGANTAAVLISDVTTQGSQIFGSLQAQAGGSTAAGDAPAVFIANANGVLVGAGASIDATHGLALLGYQPNQSGFGATPQLQIDGTTQTVGGAVTVAQGAQINAGYMLVAGSGAISVGAGPAVGAAASNATWIAAGSAVTVGGSGVQPTLGAGFNTAATVEFVAAPTTLGVAQLAAAGNVTVDGNAHVILATPATAIFGAVPATIGGHLVNHGDLILTNDVTSPTGVFAAVALNVGGDLISDGGIYFDTQYFSSNLTLASSHGNVLLGGVIRDSQNSIGIAAATVTIDAPAGSVILDTPLVTTTGNRAVTLSAGQQVGIGVQSALLSAAGIAAAPGSITTPLTATLLLGEMLHNFGFAPPVVVTLETSGTVAPVNPALSSGLGVVIGNQGGVTTGVLNVSNATLNGAAGSSLFNGSVSAASSFSYSGDSFYQGKGATITTPSMTFDYSGDITGGVAAWTQSADLYRNGVVFDAPAGGATAVTLVPGKLGSHRQNTNLLLNGNATLTATLPGVVTPVTSTTSITVNNAFTPSNLFVRAAGGSISLHGNASDASVNATANNAFYWPGALYLSTVSPGMLAQLAPIVGGGSVGGVAEVSNAMPVTGAGLGLFLMSNSAPSVTTLVSNVGSNVNVTTIGRPSFTNVVGGSGTATAYTATQTGNALVYGTAIGASQVVDASAGLPNE